MNHTDTIKMGVILGSTRQGRFGDKPAQWILEKADERGEIDAELLDLRDYPMPFFDEPVSPAAIKEPYTNDIVARWTQKIGGMDAFIIATPEYNHGYSAVVKNALDYVYGQWIKKPVGFVSWGSFGGTRSVSQLLQVVVELQMVPVRSSVHITRPWELLDERGNLKTAAFDVHAKSANSMIEELITMSHLLKPGRSV
jgi:NAD(P)H-dependent FMN reductase